VPVALLNYLDRQMLAAMKFSIMQDIPDIGREANWGQILALFKWTYAFLSPIGGYLADRTGKARIIIGSLFIWSAITWWTGHVTTFEQMLWARAIMGISEAFYIPAALALIADYHTGPTRSRAVGAHQMGIYVGVILGGFSGYIADAPALGWRWGFSVCGIIGMLYAFPLAFLVKDPVRPPSPAGFAFTGGPPAQRRWIFFGRPAAGAWRPSPIGNFSRGNPAGRRYCVRSYPRIAAGRIGGPAPWRPAAGPPPPGRCSRPLAA
jgi:MFS family permease